MGTFNSILLFMFKAHGFNLKEIAMFCMDADAVCRPWAASSVDTCRRCSSAGSKLT